MTPEAQIEPNERSSPGEPVPLDSTPPFIADRGSLGARFRDFAAVAAAVIAAQAFVANRADHAFPSGTLLNVSYDATRRLYEDVDAAFANEYRVKAGRRVTVTRFHGGSSSQARRVVEGLEADVVTLALFTDIDLLRKGGLLAEGWADRLPNHSQPYSSTIVFVVRHGNPRRILDWVDLVRPDVGVVTANPKTSGSGKLAFLAAWGSVIRRGGDDEEAKGYVRDLYAHVVALGSGAQTTATEFVEEKVGDVELAWENEALAQASASAGELEVVDPPTSIRAEPYVAWVDAYVTRHRTEEVAREYLEFLFTTAGQDLLARNGCRPFRQDVFAAHSARFGAVDLFPVQLVAKSWQDAAERFFGDGGIYDGLFRKRLL